MDIILIIVAVVLSELIILKVRSIVRFGREVSKLFSRSKDISEKTFHYGQLAGLPEPVQRYFRHVLKEGQPYISYVRLFHKGRFRKSLKSGWRNIEGQEYFTTENPGMIWKGRTALFTAIDKYVGGKGQLKVFFLSLFRILKKEGSVYDKSELIRWLAESIWFPTNLLPDERLQWEPIDSHHSLLCFQHADIRIFFKVSFNDKGEIIEFETKRYMDALRQPIWFGRVGSYQDHNGILIPGMVRGLWRLKECDFCYAEFEVTRIEYNNADGTDKYFFEERPVRKVSSELVLNNSI